MTPALDGVRRSPALVQEYQRRRLERSFEAFVRAAWHVVEPATVLKWNWHMSVLCAYLEALAFGRLAEPRLIINVPPGTSKSLLASVLWPAWQWTWNPAHRFLATSNDGPLVVRDSQKQRFVVESEWYQGLWGHRVTIDSSQREKTLFQTSKLGFRQGIPLRGNVTGKRGDTQIMDDPHDAKKAFSELEILSDLLAYDQAFSTRVNDAELSRRLLIMQRLRTNDLTGHLLKKSHQKWVHLCIPMEYEGSAGYDPVKDLGPAFAHLRDPRRAIGELMDPARFSRKSVAVLAEDLGEYGKAGQLQQRPTPLGGGIIKAKWWKRWSKGEPLPEILHVFCSWDTAFTERDHAQASFSVCLDWGVFYHDQLDRHCLMLLEAWYDRVDYPALRKRAKEKQLQRKPDAHLIEKKASGQSMIQDLRRGHIK
ncbi:MAG: hypothetical protein WBG92_15175, partial [Thiohalocapsa sp.]